MVHGPLCAGAGVEVAPAGRRGRAAAQYGLLGGLPGWAAQRRDTSLQARNDKVLLGLLPA